MGRRKPHPIERTLTAYRAELTRQCQTTAAPTEAEGESILACVADLVNALGELWSYRDTKKLRDVRRKICSTIHTLNPELTFVLFKVCVACPETLLAVDTRTVCASCRRHLN